MDRPTQIGGGIQYHHQHNLGGAHKDAVNAAQWLRGVVAVTGAPEHQALLREAVRLSRAIDAAHREAQASMAAQYVDDPARFYRCRKGLEAWPDERAEGFEPICSCEHRCLLHHTQAATATAADCNCHQVCPRHLIERMPGDRMPLLSLPLGPGQTGPPSFRVPSNN
jgi:hypothetical protein